MSELFEFIVDIVCWTMFLYGSLWILEQIPYRIRKGWGDGENKNKKVCDICFRDIKKWNKKYEDYKKEVGQK